MAYLFSEPWMNAFAKLWNADPKIIQLLSEQYFNAKLGYGFIKEGHPKGVLIVVNGRVTDASRYKAQVLDWDLRAEADDWQHWLQQGFNISRVGFAVSQKKLIFVSGDYRQILRHPPLATAFLRSFELMSQIKTHSATPAS